LLPLSSSGIAIIAAALPPDFSAKAAEHCPPGSFWFFELLLTVCHG
jgi:hypothetical protein